MRGQFTEQLLSRAERDPEFRAQMIEDPTSAIEEELGIDVPEGIQVTVVQERPDEAILVLPRHLEPGQLRDEELLVVAGGGGGCGTEGNSAAGSTCTW
jgi:hypothetical protein